MTLPSEFVGFVAALLDSLAIPYQVGGSVASSVHGMYRASAVLNVLDSARGRFPTRDSCSDIERILRSNRVGLVLALIAMAACGWSRSSWGDSDLILGCPEGCPVGVGERARAAHHFRQYDLVFEGQYLRADTIRAGSEEGRLLLRFRMERVLRGFASNQEASMLWLGRGVPVPGTRVLACIQRGCETDYPCGNFVTVQKDRTMLWSAVSGDWREESDKLCCDSLEKDVLAKPDSSGLDPFGAVVALGTAMPDIRDPANPTRPGAIPSGFPSNGGTWGLSDVRWVFGMPTHSPVYVRFTRVRGSYMAGPVEVGDRLLVAIHTNESGDTLIADPNWHPMLVRNGEAAGFGVPADSLRHLYDMRGPTFVLRSSAGR